MIVKTETVLAQFKQSLAEYAPQLEKALASIQVLNTSEPNSAEFIEALVNLQVCATILEPYSEGMLTVINQFTENMYNEDN